MAKPGVGAKINAGDLTAITRYDRLPHTVPAIGAVNIAGTQGAAFQIAELIELPPTMQRIAGSCRRRSASFDPCFGFLHDGRKPGRLSLVWDCVELHRPKLGRAVFGYASGRVFRKSDFRLIDDGIVRLAPPVMKEVAAATVGTITLKDMMKTVEWMARLVRKGV